MEAMNTPQVLSWVAFYEDRKKKSTAFNPMIPALIPELKGVDRKM
jgi:hypothetical protein